MKKIIEFNIKELEKKKELVHYDEETGIETRVFRKDGDIHVEQRSRDEGELLATEQSEGYVKLCESCDHFIPYGMDCKLRKIRGNGKANANEVWLRRILKECKIVRKLAKDEEMTEETK